MSNMMPTEIDDEPSLQDPPIPPPEGIQGKTFNRKKQREKRRTYVLKGLHTFTPKNYSEDTPADFQKVFYYQGLTFDEDNSSEESTFICFSDKDLAKKIWRYSRKVKNSRVLRADFCKYNKVVGRYLVCFPHFDDFLAQDDAKKKFLSRVQDSVAEYYFNSKEGLIDGHPYPKAIEEIIAVTRGIAVCYKCGVTSTLLGEKRGYVGYVLSGEEVMILVDDDCNEELKLKNHLIEFKEGLEELIIPLPDGKTEWKQRGSFFKCFSHISIRLAILEIFEIVYHGLSTGDCGGLTIPILKGAIDNKDAELCDAALIYEKWVIGKLKPKKVWTDFKKPSKVLYDIFTRHNNRDAYEWHKVGGLIRFLKNIYSHFADKSVDARGFVVKSPLNLNDAFKKVTDNWPFLVDRIHERCYGG